MKTKLKIQKVWIETRQDNDPDLSYLGKYSNEPGENAIDRAEHHHQGRGELRYFHAANHQTIDEWDHVTDKQVVEAYAKLIQGGHHELDREAMIVALNRHQRLQDYQRMEAYNLGHWHMVGIIAKAELWNPRTQVTQVVRSGGLWGIESDSDKDFLKQVAAEQLADLQGELEAMGFGDRAIKRAFNKVEGL